MKQQIIMHKKTASGYDEIYPDTSADNILTNQTIAENVGVSDTDAQTVLESVSATDKMISGYGTTSGTASAYTVSLVGKEDMTPVDGMMIKVKFHVDSNEEPTIDVNGSGAKSIYTENGLKVLGKIRAGAWVMLMKSDTLDGWVMQGWCKRRRLYTEIFTSNTSWTPPDDVKLVTVMVFGAGGAGSSSLSSSGSGSAGGGGHYSKNVVALQNRLPVTITIGQGNITGTGGTTSFGNYLSANGGEIGYGFNGGDGGSGGGGGDAGITDYNARGGDADVFGGGGGGNSTNHTYYCRGGNGGYYGGAGGGGRSSAGGNTYNENGQIKYYGGNPYEPSGGSAVSGGGGAGYSHAGYSATSATFGGSGGVGQNTIGLGLDFEGAGTAGLPGKQTGQSNGGGGGGYGGKGGSAYRGTSTQYRGGGGAGGGFGADGGDGNYCGGGGGGYGGKGGNGTIMGAGGGGGYGLNGNGGDGANSSHTAGYDGGIAAGGGGTLSNYTPGKGGNGVCVITYYSDKEMN